MGYFDDLPPISGEAPPPAPPPPALQNTDDEPKHGGYFDGLSPITPPADIASRALTQAAQDGQSPDQAATAMKVADDLGVGLPAVQGNLPDYQAQAEVKANQALLRDNPQLAHWLGRNPQAAPLVRDDMQSMANLDSSLIAMAAVAAGPLTPTLVAGAALFEPDAVKAGAEEAYITNQRGRTGVQLQAANLGLPGDKAAIEAEIAGYNRQLGAIPVSDSAGAAAVRNVTSFVVGYLDNAVKGGLPAGLGGAAVGAGVGAAAGGVGAGPGAVIGGATAFGTGTMADMAEVATGNAYLNLKGMTSKDGQPMSEGAAQVGALATGIFTYVIGSKFNALEAKILGITPEIMAQRAVAKALQEQTTASIIRDATTGVVKSALSGGAMMGTMEAGTILAEEAAKLMSPGEYDHDPAQMAERVFQATMNGVFMIGLTHGAMKGIGLFGDMRSADTADQLGKALTDVMNGTEATKLHSRSAMAMRSFLQSYTNGGPVEDMRIPDSVIRNFYAKTGIKPGEENDPFKFVDDMQQQMTDAQNVGGADIVMKTADFVNNFAGTEFAKELIPDVRIGANAMTMREAAEFEKEYQERVKDAMSEAGNKEAELTPQDQTYHEIFKNLSEQGVPIEQARYVATVAASRYNARAERFNEGMAEAGPYKPTDAYQEFKRSGLVFQRAAGPSEGGMLQTAWHGSPHEHEGFANDAIGTGQCAASYGFGHYVAENPTVSREYQRELARHSIYVGGAEHKRIDIDPAAEATPEAIRQENIDSLHHEMVDGSLRVRAGEAIKRHAQTLVDRIKSLQAAKERANKGFRPSEDPRVARAHDEDQKFYDEELRVAKAALDDLRDIASKGIEIKAKSYHYKVDVPDELVAKMLLHDKPLAEQPEAVRNLVTQHPELFGEPHPWAVLGSNAPADEGTKGNELYDRLARSMEVQHGEQRDGGQRLASEWLEQRGVPGIKYLDEGSRFLPPDQTPTHNLVVFNGKNIKLLERENAEGEKRFFQSILSPDAPARQPPNSPGALPARIPTGKGAEQPLDNILASSLSAARADPKHLEKIVNAVAQEPGMEGARRIRGVEAKLQWIVNKMRDNIIAVHDAMDAQIRERAKLWYQGGRNISERLGQRWGKTTEQVAGMIATLSPQKDWFMNTSMAERLGDIMHTQMDHVWDKDMHAAAFSYLLPDALKPEDKRKVSAAFDVAHGKSLREVLATGNQTAVGVWLRAYDEAHHSSAYSVISPEGDFNDTVKTQKGKEAGNAWQSFEAIGAAASIFMDGSRENISEQLGNNHKVRNFYNNILNPHDPRFTTVDTHATAVAHLSPMSSKDQAVNNVFSGAGFSSDGF